MSIIAPIPTKPDWPAGAPRAWLFPSGVMPDFEPCVAVEGTPGTFVTHSSSGTGSYPISAMPMDAQRLVPDPSAEVL